MSDKETVPIPRRIYDGTITRIKELEAGYESILCLCSEGREFHTSTELLEAIEKIAREKTNG